MNLLWAIPAIPAGFVMYDQIYKRVRQFRLDNIAERRAALRVLRQLKPNEMGQLGALLHPDSKKGVVVQGLDDHTIADRDGIVSRDDLAFRLHRMERVMYAIASGGGVSRDDMAGLIDEIDAPAPELQTSTLSNLFDKYNHTPDLRHILIGETIDPTTNQIVPLTIDLPESVHAILTGASGLGKSTLLEAIALQLARIENVQLAAIDYGSGTFDGIEKHLAWQLADLPQLAIALMAEIIKEIARRQALYKKFGRVRSVEQYNTIATRFGEESLPFIAVMIDETSPLLDEPGTKKPIIELARTGRKYGVGLIFGGTDFKADSMPTQARGNCQARMSFWLESGLSRSLFNCGDANKLTGKGDLLIRRAGQVGLVRGRTPIVVDADYRLLDDDNVQQRELVAVRDPNPTADVSDDQIKNALIELAKSDHRFSRAAIEKKLYGYTGGRAHRDVKRIAESIHAELETLLGGNK